MNWQTSRYSSRTVHVAALDASTILEVEIYGDEPDKFYWFLWKEGTILKRGVETSLEEVESKV